MPLVYSHAYVERQNAISERIKVHTDEKQILWTNTHG